MESNLSIHSAQKSDVAAILGFIKKLAEYEKLTHEVVTTEADLLRTLFGEKPYAEGICVI